MKNIDYTRLWELLADTAAANIAQVCPALDSFIEELRDYYRREPGFAERSRMLNLVRSGLRVQLAYSTLGAGEKCAHRGARQTGHPPRRF